MNDDKRQIRELKREVKRSGNRKRRRYLKDLSADPSGFDYGHDRSDTMNERKKRTVRRRHVTDATPDEPFDDSAPPE
jgi:hypothetical protein